jgi:hypothetical protein
MSDEMMARRFRAESGLPIEFCEVAVEQYRYYANIQASRARCESDEDMERILKSCRFRELRLVWEAIQKKGV